MRDKVRFWHALLAVVAVKPGGNGQRIEHCRCLKPVLGFPGGAAVGVSRASLAQYLAEDKRIIPAHCDGKQDDWKEGDEIHLTSAGHLRTDANEDEQDNMGDLPEFATDRCGR